MGPPTRVTRRAGSDPPTTSTGLDPGTRKESSADLVLGRYRLRKQLGVGGFGSVWLARDERLERDVAVKILPRERVIGGRFEREARAAARLSHPAIVTLYEAAVDDDAAYLVSELVRGATFAQLLRDDRLSDRDIVTVGIAVCDALEHAHRHGVVHRDVKPSNVLVPEHPPSPAQVAKLTDFGVARVIGGNPLTRTGDVVGTAAYMAPEQAEGREVDAAADLYSLALVLYEALTGVNPIETAAAAGRTRRAGAHLPPLRRHRRDLPRELGSAIDLALRPRPGERGTLAGFRKGLQQAQALVDDEPLCPVEEAERPHVEPGWPVPPPLSEPRWPSGGATRPPARPPVPLPAPSPVRAPLAPPDRSPDDNAPPPERPRWPARITAAAGAAAIAVWLLVTNLHPRPLPAAAAALAVAVTVAVLPRLGWVALTVIAAAALSSAGRAGAAAVLVIALLVPVTLLPRRPTRWPVAAVAPVLGIVLLAGAWPALAGRDRGSWRRAALGFIGWIWVVIAGLLAGRADYVQVTPGIPARAMWTGSIDHALGRVLWPLVHTGLLAPALVWAAAAAVLPWILRGPVRVRIVVVVVWSAALASATTTTLRTLHAGVSMRPGAVVLGAVAAGIVALAPTVLTRRPDAHTSSDTVAGLA